MTLPWTPEQIDALNGVNRWLKTEQWTTRDQVYTLFGFAGTGKTTLARHLAEGAGNVLFCAYTGKASLVLRQKGCEGARTIHSLIYKVTEKDDAQFEDLLARQGRLFRELEADPHNAAIERELTHVQRLVREEQKRLQDLSFRLDPTDDIHRAKLIVVDECSMIDKTIALDLIKLGKRLLVLGDPGQLWPIGRNGQQVEPYFMKRPPNSMLTVPSRHAADSAVLRMATMVRKGQRLEVGDYGDGCEVYDAGPRFNGVVEGRMLEAEQALLYTNDSRWSFNAGYRRERALTSVLPSAGERVTCFRNDHKLGLLNGEVYTVTEDVTPNSTNPLRPTWINTLDSMDEERRVLAHVDRLVTRFNPRDLTPRERRARMGAQEFEYGYGMTVHKAQGSQWRDVFVLNEYPRSNFDHRNWLYTAITRASDRVTVANYQERGSIG